jgi:hypothetical protein
VKRTLDFQTIRSEGGLLPPDLLRRVLDPKEKLDGTRPEDYGLPTGERPNEVITQSWNRLRKHWTEFRAAAQLAAHERVREAARTRGRVTVQPVLPVDILGAYVLLPLTPGVMAP